MTISALTIRLLLLFVPGILWSCIADTFTVHKDRKPFFFVIQSFIFGFASYLSYWVLIHAIHLFPFSVTRPSEGQVLLTFARNCPKVAFIDSLLNKNSPIFFPEIVVVCLLALILSLVYTWAYNKKLHFRFVHRWSISKKFGDADVWGFCFNSEELDEWVSVRDHSNDLIYSGWVNAFSDSSREAELLLRDVSVYKNSTGEQLYQIGCMYISRKRDTISIEFGNVPVNGNVKWKENNDEQERRPEEAEVCDQ